MKELNLYRLKRKKVKLTTFITYIAVMLLPSIAAYYMVDVYWNKEISAYNIIYQRALHIINYSLTGTEEDIRALNNAADMFHLKASVLKARQKETVEFIKRAYVSKKVLKELLKDWKSEETEWMVLKELKWEDSKLKLDLYRIYNPQSSFGLNDMKKFFRKVGQLKENTVFNVEFINNINLERVVMELNASVNR